MTKEPTTIVNIRISKSDKALLVQAAKARGLTLSALIRETSEIAAREVIARRARVRARPREKRDTDDGWRKTREQSS